MASEAFQVIEHTLKNTHLERIGGAGIHQPYWSDIECPQCADGHCGGHAKVLACKEDDDDWPCDVAANVANELEARAGELNCRDDYELLMERVRELRGEVSDVQ